MRSPLDLLVPPTCWSCRAPARAGAALCHACAAELPWLPPQPAPCGPASALELAWAPLAFSGPARELVHALKFRGAVGVAAVLAELVADALPEPLLAPGTALVPVPAHPWRRWARGFDHAEALTTALGARTGQPVVACLRRGGAPGSRQRGRTRSERLAGTALHVGATGPVPARAVLVDDVRTTGATAEACARALRGAGATWVAAVSCVRVP